MPLSNMAVRDIETVIHPYTNLARHREVGPLILNEGRGIHLYDDTGKRYIEGMAGLWCTALGYGNQEIAEAGAEALRKISFTHSFGGKSHDGVIELSEKLKEIAPCPASKVLFGSSGSEANDMQMKLSWYYNNARGKREKKKIISRMRAYHGVTIASASLTGLPWVHNDFDLPIANVLHTSCPHYYRYGQEGETEEQFTARMAQDLEDMILREGPDTIAAFIGEPLMGAGGVLLPPKGYWEKVNAILSKYDIRFIADEVICGFGRTGNWWGFETMGFEPDIVPMAKGLSSGYLPIGAVAFADHLIKDFFELGGEFYHGMTYAGHPVAAAVALKNIEIIEREDLCGNAARVGDYLEKRLAELRDFDIVGDVRGRRLMMCVEYVKDKKTRERLPDSCNISKRISNACEADGLLVRPIGHLDVLSPPLTITKEQVDFVVDTLKRAIIKATAELRAEGVI